MLVYQSCGYILNVLLREHPRSGHGMLLNQKEKKHVNIYTYCIKKIGF
jgi:hypothetical protein